MDRPGCIDLKLVANDGTAFPCRLDDLYHVLTLTGLFQASRCNRDFNVVNINAPPTVVDQIVQFAEDRLDGSHKNWRSLTGFLHFATTNRGLLPTVLTWLDDSVTLSGCVDLLLHCFDNNQSPTRNARSLLCSNLVAASKQSLPPHDPTELGVFWSSICRLSMQDLSRVLSFQEIDVWRSADLESVIEGWEDASHSRALDAAHLRKVLKTRQFPMSATAIISSEFHYQPANSALVVLGGWSCDKTRQEIRIWNGMSRGWSTEARRELLPQPTSYHGSVLWDSQLFIVGGCDGRSRIPSIYRVDLVTGKTEWWAPLSDKRCFVSAATVIWDDQMFVVGGFNGTERLSTVDCIDMKTRRLVAMRQMSCVRSDACAAVASGRLWVAGGFDGQTQLHTIECWTRETAQWRTIGHLPSATTGAHLLFDGRSLLLLGGFDSLHRLRTVHRLRIDDAAAVAALDAQLPWRPCPSMLSRRSNFAACIVDGDLLVAGGYDEKGVIADCEMLPSCGGVDYEYHWRALPPLPEGRSAHTLIFLRPALALKRIDESIGSPAIVESGQSPLRISFSEDTDDTDSEM